MKKLYMLAWVLLIASLAGCTPKTPILPDLSTGNNQLTTQTDLTGTVSWTLTQETGQSVDAVVVPMVEGSEDISAQESDVVAQADILIEERNTKMKEENKINETDIDLWQKIIELFK